MGLKKIAVVMPAYSEGRKIKSVIHTLPRNIRVKGAVFEIVPVVVNDCSPDDTSKKAQAEGTAFVIDHQINLGAGGATRTGIKWAVAREEFDWIATMDSDGQHHPEDLVAVSRYAIENKFDFTIGSRMIDSQGMPRHRVIGNWGLNVLTRIILGVGSSDSQSGLRVFSTKAAGNISWEANGYGFCSEMLLSAKSHGYKINEYPIRAIYDEYSLEKGQSSWNALNIIKTLVSARVRSFFYE